jgi:hypothetical protein
MSGKKRTYVSIADDELRRLRQAQSRLQEVRQDLPTLLDGVRAQVRTDVARRLSEVDARQRRFDSAISGLGDQVRDVENNAQRRLDEQSRRLRKQFVRDLDATRAQLGRDLGVVRDEVSAKLAEQASAVKRALDEESTTRRRELAAVGGQVDRLAREVRSDREQAENAAQQWLSDAETLRIFIDTELAHSRFAPGRLAALSRQLDDARTNAGAGMWQAAVVAAQTAYRDLSELRTTLELRQQEHLALNAEARTQLLILRQQAAANAALKPGAGTNAGGVGFVDYWTGGQNAAVSAEIEERLRTVEADELDGEALRVVLTDDVPRLAVLLDELVDSSTEAEIASQLRASIADRVVDVLAGNGYDIEIDGGYEGSDQRRGFLAKADHEDGSRVVVTVAAIDDGRAELTVHSFDQDTGDDETRWHRADALRNQLRAEGIEMGALREAPGGPDAKVQDVPALIVATPPPDVRLGGS